MKSTDERMEDVLGRAKAREAVARRRRQRAIAAASGILSTIVVVAVGIGVSTGFGGTSDVASFAGSSSLMGSVFSGSPALGYIVIGLLGLALGAAVAVAACRVGRQTSGGEGGVGTGGFDSDSDNEGHIL